MYLAENKDTLGFADPWPSIICCFEYSRKASAGAQLSTKRVNNSSVTSLTWHTHIMG